MKSRRRSRRSLICSALLLASAVGAGAGCDATSSIALSANQVGSAPASPQGICGSAILHSPWNYSGKAGTYTAKSEPKGLPTFGSAGTNFPYATKIIVVPAGNNTTAAIRADYQVNYAIVYFEPGVHQMKEGIYNGHNAAYVGGYSAAHGAAIIDGVAGATGGTGRPRPC